MIIIGGKAGAEYMDIWVISNNHLTSKRLYGPTTSGPWYSSPTLTGSLANETAFSWTNKYASTSEDPTSGYFELHGCLPTTENTTVQENTEEYYNTKRVIYCPRIDVYKRYQIVNGVIQSEESGYYLYNIDAQSFYNLNKESNTQLHVQSTDIIASSYSSFNGVTYNKIKNSPNLYHSFYTDSGKDYYPTITKTNESGLKAVAENDLPEGILYAKPVPEN